MKKNLKLLLLAFVSIVFFAMCTQSMTREKVQEPIQESTQPTVAKLIASVDTLVGVRKSHTAALRRVSKHLASMDKVYEASTGNTFYYPLKRERISTANYASYYIGVSEDYTYWKRLKFQLRAENWVFADRLTFSLEGKHLDGVDISGNFNRDNQGGTIWESLDIEAGEAEAMLISAMAISKRVQVHYIGKYTASRDVTLRDKRAMIKTQKAIALLEDYHILNRRLVPLVSDSIELVAIQDMHTMKDL